MDKIITFEYMNMGIDKWSQDPDFTNFDQYVKKYVDNKFDNNINIKDIKDGNMDIIDQLNHTKVVPLNFLKNNIDGKNTYSCYIKNRFFQVYNNHLVNRVSENLKPDVFVFSEFCDVNDKKIHDIKFKIKNVDAVQIKPSIDILDLKSYYMQSYGKINSESPEIDNILKYFIVGSTKSDITVDNFIEPQNTTFTYNNDDNIVNDGCIQVSLLKINNKQDILIINVHNRFKKSNDISNMFKMIIEAYKYIKNILIIGDFNVETRFGKKILTSRELQYLDNCKKNKCNEIKNNILEVNTFYNMLKEYGFDVESANKVIDDYYVKVYKMCNTNLKKPHVKIMHKLENYELNIDIVPDCKFSFNASSHNILKFKLIYKN